MQEMRHAETMAELARMAANGERYDAVVADPPYSSGALHTTGKKAATSAKYQTSGHARFEDFSGDSRDQLSWLYWMAGWINGLRPITAPGAPVLLFCDYRQIGATINALQMGGMIYRGVVAWIKTTSRPMPGRFRNQMEFIVWGSHGSMPARPLYLPGYFIHATPSGGARIHQTQKPVPLLVDLLAIAPEGGRVLDPFAGSATTLVAARQRGLSAVGIEENATIYRKAVERLNTEPAPDTNPKRRRDAKRTCAA